MKNHLFYHIPQHEQNISTPPVAVLGSLSLAALSLAFSAPAEAVVLIGNLPQTSDANNTILQNTNVKAMGFTLPSGADYTLNNVTLRLSSYTGTDSLNVQIRNNNGTNPGTSTLVTFDDPISQGSGSFNYNFTPDSPFTFTAGEKYWLFVQAGTGVVQWTGSSPFITPTGIATFDGARFSLDGGSSYSTSSTFDSFAINVTEATPVPLESDALPIVGSALFMAGGLWWKKKRTQAKVAEFVAKK